MNIMVRFKRACAVLAAGATLAGGLALLPTVAQAVESKNVQTKAATYTITFNDTGAGTVITRTTGTDGKLKLEDVPTPTVSRELTEQNVKPDGWVEDPTNPNQHPIDFANRVFTDNANLYPHFVELKPTPTPTYRISFITVNPADPDNLGAAEMESFETNSERKLPKDESTNEEVQPKVYNFDGYTFDGWFSDNGGSRFVPGGAYTADTIFRARYTKVTTPNEPNKPGQTAPVDNNTKQPAKDNKAPAKDPAKKDAKNNNTLAQTGADAVAPLAIAAGLCLAAGITLGLRRKLAL
ncbi:LPXTG cell wall anchor domain-containing protein [Bifidobacterium sp. wkB344]|uniref:LPXTG cell wall anchor domain-containing protein n=1 Tax=Bifidobacterium sp. wkB344 TaxID=2025113 RepID=UPI000EFA0D04|nr:LPXTG cell wall anchor domain-containing protein [Bifidobacterium sp. wkB344]